MSQTTAHTKPPLLKVPRLTWILLAAAAAAATIALVLALSAGGEKSATAFPAPRSSVQPQFDYSKGRVYTPVPHIFRRDPYTYDGSHDEGAAGH
jgi:hypothetical protein